ncbi:MAG: TIM barrel protein [Candidatus Thiodiazotropha sp.]
MQLKLFRTLWGFHGDPAYAVSESAEAGFDGIEGQAPLDPLNRAALGEALATRGLDYIAEITTAGSYVPDRQASPETHLATLEQGLKACAELSPLRVNCIGGCDAWSESQSLRFFQEAMERAARHNLEIVFETHRSRSLFNPWITARIAADLPELKLTADFSHWCVVCERLMDSEREIIQALAPQVHHIHARVGYDQGPQVPDPAAPEYAEALAAHQRWWEIIWQARLADRAHVVTMTPEFGPDGYLHELPFSREPVGDLWLINNWMRQREREHFTDFLSRHPA